MNYPNVNPQSVQMANNAAHTHFLSEVALTACGFQQATISSTPRQIWNIHPHGGTAMRDALLYGNNLMNRLHDLLQKEHTAANWSFLHILITDGHDTDSNATYEYTRQMLSRYREDLNVRDLKIIILGVDIQYNYARSLQQLVSAAGIHGQYQDITHTDLHIIFQRIRNDFGLINRGYANPNLQGMTQQPMEQHYAVLFTLDISGSMTGHKWEVTRHAVSDFIRYLGPSDIVSAIVFNDNPHLVMHWNTRQNQRRLGQATANQPYAELMANVGYYDPNEFGRPNEYGGNQIQQPLNQYGGNQIQRPLNQGARYVVRDPYNNDNCCCCMVM